MHFNCTGLFYEIFCFIQYSYWPLNNKGKINVLTRKQESAFNNIIYNNNQKRKLVFKNQTSSKEFILPESLKA